MIKYFQKNIPSRIQNNLTIKHFCVLKTTFWNKIHKQTKHSNSSSFTVITELLNQE